MVRPRDPGTMLPYAAHDGVSHDHNGDNIYGDYTVSYDGSAQDVTSHEPGLAQFDYDETALHYLHGNLIGSTKAISDQQSAVSSRYVYTAFGEPVYSDGTIGTRYGYAGAWGYQAAGATDPLSELGWLHVGFRYYDPSTGRFVQRDPIGVGGGLNVYEYIRSEPTNCVDPSGMLTPPPGFGISPERINEEIARRGGMPGPWGPGALGRPPWDLPPRPIWPEDEDEQEAKKWLVAIDAFCKSMKEARRQKDTFNPLRHR